MNNGKIKILRIITRIDVGGTCDDILNILSKLDKNRFEQVLVFGPSQVKPPSDTKQYYLPELIREIAPIKDLMAFFAIYRALNVERPDIVHTHSSKAGFLGRWAAWLYNVIAAARGQASRTVKIVYTPHGHVFYGYEFSWIKARAFLLLERVTAPITDKLLALTEGEKKESIAFGVGAPEQWDVINSGVDLAPGNGSGRIEARSKFKIPDNAVVIGTVARLEPVKGVKYFVEAVKLLSEKNLTLPLYYLIVGDGSEMNDLRTLVKRWELKDNVIFTGMRNDVQDLMSAMDIYVQPSLNEGMGKTLIQAHSAGLPIIASNVQGIPDIVKDGVSGYLVPPKDPRALAKAMLKLINDPKQRASMAASGKESVCALYDGLPRFCCDRMIYLLQKTYNDLQINGQKGA